MHLSLLMSVEILKPNNVWQKINILIKWLQLSSKATLSVAEEVSLCCSTALLIFNFIVSFCWIPHVWAAGVWMETALFHWFLVSLSFMYTTDSHLIIITFLLQIGWNQWPWQGVKNHSWLTWSSLLSGHRLQFHITECSSA